MREDPEEIIRRSHHGVTVHPQVNHVDAVGHEERQDTANDRESQQINPARRKLLQVIGRQHQPRYALLLFLLSAIERAGSNQEVDKHGNNAKGSHGIANLLDAIKNTVVKYIFQLMVQLIGI